MLPCSLSSSVVATAVGAVVAHRCTGTRNIIAATIRKKSIRTGTKAAAAVSSLFDSQSSLPSSPSSSSHRPSGHSRHHGAASSVGGSSCAWVAMVIASSWTVSSSSSALGYAAGLSGDMVSLHVHAWDRKSTRLNSSHSGESRMPSSA